MAQEGYRFIVYGGDGRAEALYHKTLKARSGGAELAFRRPDPEEFQRDLDAAGTVIANAGFALAGEALAKGKRLIMKPYAGQLEQEHNAREAERLGFAVRLQALDAPSVAAALRAAPALGEPASERPPLEFPAMLPRFVAWLEEGAPVPDEARHRAFWSSDAL
jgi:UDP:flavonoid glycosyltransferase YjiC (YdhE family)